MLEIVIPHTNKPTKPPPRLPNMCFVKESNPAISQQDSPLSQLLVLPDPQLQSSSHYIDSPFFQFSDDSCSSPSSQLSFSPLSGVDSAGCDYFNSPYSLAPPLPAAANIFDDSISTTTAALLPPPVVDSNVNIAVLHESMDIKANKRIRNTGIHHLSLSYHYLIRERT